MTTKPSDLTRQESQLIQALIKPDAQIQVIIPVDIKAAEWVSAFDATCKAIDLTFNKQGVLFPVLGRLLAVAKKNPETFKSLGYEFYDDFLERAIRQKFDWGRSSSYAAVSMVERWPDLSNQEYLDIGPAKFAVLAKAIPKGDEQKSAGRKLLAAAKTSTVAELKALTVQHGLSEEGEHDGAVFQITCNKSQLRVFCEFFGDPDIHAVCQTTDKAIILELAIGEVTAEWKNSAKGAEKVVEMPPGSPEDFVYEEEEVLS